MEGQNRIGTGLPVEPQDLFITSVFVQKSIGEKLEACNISAWIYPCFKVCFLVISLSIENAQSCIFP